MTKTQTGSRGRNPRASVQPQPVAEEEEDALADLLGDLARGPSQWYTLNGDVSTKLSLSAGCLASSQMPTTMFFVSKNLAGYRLNKSSHKEEVEILVGKWRAYINNKRYKIVSPENTEVDTN